VYNRSIFGSDNNKINCKEVLDMKVGGGIVALIASLFSVVMAFITLGIGGLGSAFGGEGADTVIGLGWAGVFLSFIIIAFAVASMFAKSKMPAIAVIVLSIITALAGGTLVAIFMVLALIGRIMALIGVSKEIKSKEVVV